MKVTQISDFLNNNVLPQVIGNSVTIEEDLTNIVDVGRAVFSSTENVDNFKKVLMDAVGKTIIANPKYKSKLMKIYRDGVTYGSVLAKIRTSFGTFTDSETWKLGADDANTNPYDIEDDTMYSVKYYNQKNTVDKSFSIPDIQLNESFTSATALATLITALETNVMNYFEVVFEQTAFWSLRRLIAEKINANNNVINLLDGYKNETGDTALTAEKALFKKEFLLYAVTKINEYRTYISDYSSLHNISDIPTFSNDEMLITLVQFSSKLEAYLQSDTFNKELVQFGDFTKVSGWQSTGKNHEFSEQSKIISKISSDATITKSGIVAVLLDANAVMVCNENFRTYSLFNPKTETTNYFYKYDVSNYVDTAENAIIFTIED